MGALTVGAQRWVAVRLDQLAQVGRRRHEPRHLLTGERGELEAYFFLRSMGWTVVARRWTTGRLPGDLDLVAWEGETLCFVEVKTRSGARVGAKAADPAEAAVDMEKRKMLRRMGAAYVRQLPERLRDRVAVRFDVVSVYLAGEGVAVPRVELLRGVFGRREPMEMRGSLIFREGLRQGLAEGDGAGV